MMKLTEIVGPGKSWGGETGFWEIVHLQKEGTELPLCGRNFHDSRHDHPNYNLILRVDCANCSRLAETP